MKNILLFMTIFGLALFSCKKDETKVQLNANPKAPVITAPIANSTIAIGRHDSLTMYKFTWDSATYGGNAVVTYTLEADTAGGNFSTAIALGSTTTGSFINMTLFTLNTKVLNALRLSANDSLVTSTLDLRVRCSLDGGLMPLTSNIVSFKVTTWRVGGYKEPDYAYIWAAGNFPANNWSSPNYPLASITSNQRYEGWFYFSAAGQQYKLYSTKDQWSTIPSWGDGGNNVLIEADCACSNFTVPAAGLYQVNIKLDSMKAYQNPVTWSILGAATPGGWTTDTDLAPDATGLVWTVTCNMLASGDFKFRANHAWDIDYTQHPPSPGVTDIFANRLAHSNDKWGEPYVNLPNLKVPSDGNYTITLDLRVAGKPTYIFHKN